MEKHIPVLLGRVLDTLGDIRGKTIVDGTFGAGGYSRAFLERGAKVIAFDRDPNVMADVEKISSQYPDSFEFIASPFSEILNKLTVPVDAVVFDFGISSMQIDQGPRGFSFRFDGPLDMRMECEGQTAAELIEALSVSELARILAKYGDVKRPAMFADIIKKSAPKTTFELKGLLHNPKDVAPVFQALRIAVNDELGEIETALSAMDKILTSGGQCICVTFHSLEDRLVKATFNEWTKTIGDPRLPVLAEAPFSLLKSFRPDAAELENNSRARSAHMRAVLKN